MAETNPFGSAGTVGAGQGPASSTTSSMLDDASDFLGAASEMAGQARQARRAGNSIWLERIQNLAETMLEHLIEFTKKAITLAAVKFIVELCAMAIKKLMEVIASRFSYQFDITTPGIVYTGDKKVFTAGPDVRGGNPFDMTSFGGRGNGVSYM